MYTRHVAFNLHQNRKLSLFFLAFFSIFGAYLGAVTAHTSDLYLLPLMRMTVICPVSIVSLVFVTLLPFLITAIALLLMKPFLLLPVAFFNSFSYTLVLCAVISAFDAGGWLVGTILLFSNSAVQLGLFCFWIRHINGFGKSAAMDLVTWIVVSLTFSIIDYAWVSPYLVRLMNF